jgi:hypothetical protein
MAASSVTTTVVHTVDINAYEIDALLESVIRKALNLPANATVNLKWLGSQLPSIYATITVKGVDAGAPEMVQFRGTALAALFP